MGVSLQVIVIPIEKFWWRNFSQNIYMCNVYKYLAHIPILTPLEAMIMTDQFWNKTLPTERV